MTEPLLLTARWVVGHADSRHCLYRNGEIVVSGDRILFVGHGYGGRVARRIDYGNALIGPGFVDLDALSDLDTTVLGYDNQPAWKKGRIWPESYIENGPFEMYSAEELAFQKRYAFSRLIRSGITTALPIASLFYRQWGETVGEFTAAADAARDLGLRVYLGPAYRSGNSLVRHDGSIDYMFDEERGFKGLSEATEFCRRFEGQAGGLIRTMLAPDRIETCTPDLLKRSAAAAADLDVPIRLHCCQSRFEYDSVLKLRGMSPAEWLASLGFLSPRAILPHGTHVSGRNGIDRPGRDLEILRDGGGTIVHCPLVSARHGTALQSFRQYRDMGIRIGLGTDTYPPDMFLNMQVGMMLCRIEEGGTDGCRSEDFFDAATIGGADALGRPDLGRLQAGAAADLIVVDFDDPFMGQTIDPIQTLMLNASAQSVKSVMIGGRFVMEDGVIPGVNDRAYRQRAQEQFEGVVAKYPLRTFGHPPVEEIFSSSYRLVDRAPTG
ncbi:amidohydrolase family protein [Pararhizobium sp. BT-229]|uniref:amidohydrolase family protein n=1 Tax=Pararhizobium sp. BT-229 TaxID=2986923 RepID=UPI0021F73A03|nr:amidohydrolase family protein [Pararhizobium sp. BT-229]MCV9962012.1 amidohydrolase family protein [Pararhizobium sp. BT-229]